MAYIYKIINDINEKIYVGKTNLSIEERWRQHKKDRSKIEAQKRPLYRAIKKYGIEYFHIELIEECTNDIVNEREKYWIEQYGSFKNGYNATLGGDGKSYIDYDLVVKTYQQLHNQTKVADILNISQDSVSIILRERGIEPLSSDEVNQKAFGKMVAMLDIKTKQILKTFASQSEAARWLIKEKKTITTDTTKISSKIGLVVRNKRKTAFGYIWKSI